MTLTGTPVAATTGLPKESRGSTTMTFDAQNTGNFDAYQSLCAPSFSGVRRSGPRNASFDRAGWMADRQRMFQKPTVDFFPAVVSGRLL